MSARQSSSAPTPPIDDATREQIVAYLDGELPDAESHAIESRLAADAALRDEVQGLDRVWNALDDLPRVTVDDAFTRSTIAMAAVEAKQDAAAMTAALPVARRRRGYAVAAACFAAAAVSFLLVRGVLLTPERRLIADLPVVYQVDALQNFQQPEFLRKLPVAAPGLLSAGDGEAVDQAAAAWQRLADADGHLARIESVRAMPEGERARLMDDARRYREDLSPARRGAIASLYAQVQAAEDRDALMRTALSYQAWLTTRTAAEQARLRDLPTDARLAELAKIDREESSRPRGALSSEDAAALRSAVAKLGATPELTRLATAVRERLQAVAAGGEGGPDDAFARRVAASMSEWAERAEASPTLSVMLLADVAGRPNHRLSQLFRGQWDRTQQQAASDWQAVEARLLAALSEQPQKRLRRAPDDQRRGLLALSVMRAAREGFESFDEEAFFASDDLTDEDRHTLLALPSEQMRERLRELYIERQLGGGMG
ncbi:MAG: hypothetical protein AAF790_08240, partial [Planctomycetota bacterium]